MTTINNSQRGRQTASFVWLNPCGMEIFVRNWVRFDTHWWTIYVSNGKLFAAKFSRALHKQISQNKIRTVHIYQMYHGLWKEFSQTVFPYGFEMTHPFRFHRINFRQVTLPAKIQWQYISRSGTFETICWWNDHCN